MNNAVLKNLLIILGLLTVAFAGYYMYRLQGDTVLNTNSTNAEYQDVLLNTQAFIRHRQELNAVRIDSNVDLFTDERFRTLQSFSGPLDQVEAGRTNPFEAVSEGS